MAGSQHRGIFQVSLQEMRSLLHAIHKCELRSRADRRENQYLMAFSITGLLGAEISCTTTQLGFGAGRAEWRAAQFRTGIMFKQPGAAPLPSPFTGAQVAAKLLPDL